MSSQAEVPAPEQPVKILEDCELLYGRYYGTHKRDKYLCPIDQEEVNRHDIFHKVFLVARDNKPIHAKLEREKPRILDLATGSGIWPISLIEESYVPDAQIMMVDLHKIQPALIPIGVTPLQFDVEDSDWSSLMKDCDFIHMRMLFGSIHASLWPQTYRNVFNHLAPGIGQIEQVEIDWAPKSDEEKQPSPLLQYWSDQYYEAAELYGRTARIVPGETRRLLEEAGFTDIKEQTVKAWVCPWSQDPRDREIGRWFNLALSHSLDALTLKPFVEKLGYQETEVRQLNEDVKKEICLMGNHTYCTVHIWTARKPGACQ